MVYTRLDRIDANLQTSRIILIIQYNSSYIQYIHNYTYNIYIYTYVFIYVHMHIHHIHRCIHPQPPRVCSLEVPPASRSFLVKMLTKDPKMRSTAQLLLTDAYLSQARAALCQPPKPGLGRYGSEMI